MVAQPRVGRGTRGLSRLLSFQTEISSSRHTAVYRFTYGQSQAHSISQIYVVDVLFVFAIIDHV